MVAWFEQISREYVFKATYMSSKDGHMRLIDISTDAGVYFRDHIYLPYTKRFKRLELERFDVIRFRAKVNSYRKKHPAFVNLPRHPKRLVRMICLTNIHVLGVQRG